jgi:NTP pyrophosphatase (non-canonical NTP hydrolase)
MSSALAQLAATTIAEYFAKAHETDRFASEVDGFEKLRFGFFGEVGGLLAAVKKVGRDELKETETELAGEEIGDALWYLVSVAQWLGISADDLGTACMRSLRQTFAEADRSPAGAISFRNLDGILGIHGTGLESRRVELIGALADASGKLLAPSEETLRAMAPGKCLEQLGRLLSMLALVSASFGLRFEELAEDNLAKIRRRWPVQGTPYTGLFDELMLPHEQLPRTLKIEFIERDDGRGAYVVQELNGVLIGDRLTDNHFEPDDYRFHDVFHLAYMAHLGWSPVIRALLKRKRKSNRAIDENEDGARAMIIEEGIATWIFNHAKKRGDFFEGVKPEKLEYGLLKQVESMVAGYEVCRCPLWQWARAILDGFAVFRELRSARGGIVTVNMLEHTIGFEQRAVQP